MRQFRKTRKNTQMRRVGGWNPFANKNNSDNFDSILDKYTELVGLGKGFLARTTAKSILQLKVNVKYIDELIKMLKYIRERHSKNLSNEQQFDEILPVLLIEFLQYIKSVHSDLAPKIDNLLKPTINNENPVMTLLTKDDRKTKILSIVGNSDLTQQLLDDLEAVRKYKMGTKYTVTDKEAISENSPPPLPYHYRSSDNPSSTTIDGAHLNDSARPADSASISEISENSPPPLPYPYQSHNNPSSTMPDDADFSHIEGFIGDLSKLIQEAKHPRSCINENIKSSATYSGGSKKRRTSKRHTKRHTKRHKRNNKKRYTKKRR